MHTKIKICGITQRDDLEFAAHCGVSAIGLVFQPSSPRYLDYETAKSLLVARPPFLSIVALFMDAPASAVHELLGHVSVDYLQFHGSESVDYCTAFNKPYIKTIPLGSVDDIQAYAKAYRSTTSAFLLDSNRAGVHGGSGQTFDWAATAPQCHGLPLILAGGLSPDNVTEGITLFKPLAVDVASGVESTPGRKDKQKILAFVSAVRAYHSSK